ncbi:MAG: hemerythrin domain-containing protein [Anaerolineaceae bacterium]
MEHDPIKMLKDDHKVVKKLFDEFEAADKRSMARIAREAITELEIHAEIEEEIFYPAVNKAVGDEMVMAEAEQEHHVVHLLIAELKQMLEGGKTGVDFQAKFTVLAENVRHHIKEEETEMLPLAAKMPTAELESVGARMAKSKSELKSQASKIGSKRL